MHIKYYSDLIACGEWHYVNLTFTSNSQSWITSHHITLVSASSFISVHCLFFNLELSYKNIIHVLTEKYWLALVCVTVQRKSGVMGYEVCLWVLHASLSCGWRKVPRTPRTGGIAHKVTLCCFIIALINIDINNMSVHVKPFSQLKCFASSQLSDTSNVCDFILTCQPFNAVFFCPSFLTSTFTRPTWPFLFSRLYLMSTSLILLCLIFLSLLFSALFFSFTLISSGPSCWCWLVQIASKMWSSLVCFLWPTSWRRAKV